MALQICPISSLEKVFLDGGFDPTPYTAASALRGEQFSYQLALRLEGAPRSDVWVSASGPLAGHVALAQVMNVASELPAYPETDDFYLRKQPGLYPDLLTPLPGGRMTLLPGAWRALWVRVSVPEDQPAGEQTITLRFTGKDGQPLGESAFTLTVIPAALPEQTLVYTNWFHCDCIATYYGDEVFSEAHWRRIGQFMALYRASGATCILTPVLTPPLDTEVGGERPTAQLVGIRQQGGRYSFDFSLLKRYLDLARSHGIERFEISHFFSQWGAAHAPKVIAEVDGQPRRIFGWETDAAGVPYRAFLAQFIPALLDFLRGQGVLEACYFHISDEPSLEHLDSYRAAREGVAGLLAGCQIMDALSNYDFYEQGLVDHPIPANNHIEPFLEHRVPGLWTYYCCGQHVDVSNRFIAMPSCRNRVLGCQLFKYDIAGFLQWGYNFYYSQYSTYPVNPFQTTDALQAFPSGDAFVVYPGPEGPLPSLRLWVFHEALQDMRAMQLLAGRIGKQAVTALIDEGLDAPVTFSAYPHSAAYVLSLREKINRRIAETC